MYFSKKQTQLPMESSFTPTEIANEFRKRLEEGKDRILYRVSDDGKKISYATQDELGFFSLAINYKHNIVDCVTPSSFSDTGIINVFASFLMDMDEKMSEEQQLSCYGDYYLQSKLLSDLSETDIDQYYKDKSDLSRFLANLDQTDEMLDKEALSFTFCFHLSIEDNFIETELDANCANGKKKDSVFGHNNVMGDFYFSDRRNKLDSAIKKVFDCYSFLYRRQIYVESRSYYDHDFSADTNVMNEIYDLINAIHEAKDAKSEDHVELFINNIAIHSIQSSPCKIEIDEKEKIICDVDFKSHDFTYFIGRHAASYMEENIMHFYHFQSTKATMLFHFLKDHPDMRSDLFTKEITTALVPKIASDIQVAPSVVAKSMQLINHIELFLSLEDDGIKSETRAFIKGKQVDLETYKNSEPDGFNGFAFEMQKLFLPFNGKLKDEELINQYLGADLRPLKKSATVFISEELKRLKKKPIGKISIIVSGGEQDWFHLNFKSDEYSEDEIEEILSAYKKKKKFFLLKGDYLSLTDSELGEALEHLVSDVDVDLKKLDKKIPLYQALKLKDNSLSVIPDEVMKLFEEIQDYEKVKLNLSPEIESVLRPYQIKGVQWLTSLYAHNLAGILADDMGLGKTLEMIAFLSQDKTKKPTLIISPKSLTYNWEAEFNKWNPNQKVIVLSVDREIRHKLIQNIKPDEDVVYIIPYDSLRIDLDYFKEIYFKNIIIDEGQYIANALSQKAKAIKELKSDHRFALTGTPIQNSLLDLWSIFDFLMPGYFKTFTEFRKNYGKLDITQQDREHLERIVSPFILKRKKTDVLKELPGKTVEITTLSMTKEEQDFYNAYLLKAKKSMAMGNAKKIEILAELTRLRQICVDPATFLEYNKISSKLDYTVHLLKQATGKGHKILVFSSFKQALDHLGQCLTKEKVNYDMITGETPAKRRVEIADDFNTTDSISVMLISLKAGGTGLNLIGADIVIHLDPWWNVASEEQATDRAYRIGQERKVTVYKLVMKSTVEERVISLQEKKKTLSDIIDKDPNDKQKITTEDIQYLLS